MAVARPAGPPPTTNTSQGFGKRLTINFLSISFLFLLATFYQRPSYHSSKTNSEQNPGPIAASKPSLPGAGRRLFMTSSTTTSTEADHKLPVRLKHSQQTSISPSSTPTPSPVAPRILPPPASLPHP